MQGIAAETAQLRQERQQSFDGPAEGVEFLAVGALDVGERDDAAPRRRRHVVVLHHACIARPEPEPLQAQLPRVMAGREKSLRLLFLGVPAVADAELVGPVEPVGRVGPAHAEAGEKARIQQHLEDPGAGIERLESQIQKVEQPLAEDAEPIGRVVAEVVGEQARRPFEDAAQGSAVGVHVGDEDGDVGLPKLGIAVELIDDAGMHRLHSSR